MLVKRNFVLFILFIFFIAIHISFAGLQKLLPPEAKIIPPKVKPNESVKLVISIPLGKGLHIYGPNVKEPYFATKVIIKEQGPIIWQKTPKFPKTSILNVMGQEIPVIAPNRTGNVDIIIEGKVKKSVHPGSYKIKILLTYQACTESSCLQPVVNKDVTADVAVVASGLSANKADKSVKEQSGKTETITVKLFNRSINLSDTSIFVALFIAFISGLILNVMPCVLPIIPLKILQLAEQAKREKRSAIVLSLLFSVGIIAFFLVIGIFAVILRGSFSWGMQFQHTGFVFAMILLLLWLTLGMFGVFEIALPGFIANRPMMKSGYVGAFMMGFLGGILSTPCSFGILGAAVAWAQLQEPYMTLIAFFMIGLGMALPYIILSAFPSLSERIPRAGRWTELFKQSMGFLLLAVVAFLINALPSEQLFWFLLYFVLFSFVIWLWGSALSMKKGLAVNLTKIISAIILIYTGMLLFEPNNGNAEALSSSKSSFGTFNEEVLQKELAKGKIVAVKFTANWCISCKVVEARVYHNPKVQNLIEKGVLVVLKADLTRENPVLLKKLKDWTGQTGVPFTVLFYPDGKRKLFPGKFSPDNFIEAINSFKSTSSQSIK